MEQNKTVFLLWEGDEWLSRDSLVLMGVFSMPDTLCHYAEELIRERGDEHLEYAEYDAWDFDEDASKKEKINGVVEAIMEELFSNGSTAGWDINYIWQEVELDKLEEI